MLPAGAAAGTPLDDDAVAELRRWGVPEDQIRAGRALRGPEDDGTTGPVLWAWHRDAASIFGAMRRQWRVLMGPQGGLLYLGLDLGALDGVRRMLRIRPRPELMDQLRTMEVAGAEALNSKG